MSHFLPWAATPSGLSPVGREAAATTPGRTRAARRALVASCSRPPPQDPALQLCLVQSVCMLCQAVCGSAQAGAFHFARKAELVAQMMVRPRGAWRAPAQMRGGRPGEAEVQAARAPG